VKGAVVLAVALALSCCAEADRIDLAQVLANGNCRTSEIGVNEIDEAALAEYRGTRLLDMTQSSGSKEHPIRLVAIAPGEYPTPGYSVTLGGESTLRGRELTIVVKISKPPADAILAQMITHPCLVVGVGDPKVERIRVVDDDARLIGELTLAPKRP
jgi:PrcB C-terminal